MNTIKKMMDMINKMVYDSHISFGDYLEIINNSYNIIVLYENVKLYLKKNGSDKLQKFIDEFECEIYRLKVE